jgi:hypothetical protein
LAELALAFALVHLFDLFVATVHRQIGPSDLTVSLRNSRICCSDTHYSDFDVLRGEEEKVVSQ